MKLFGIFPIRKIDIAVRSKKGVTLLELVISIAIAAIVIGIIFSLNIFGIRTFAVQDRQSSIQTDVRLAADSITRELRLAQTIEILSAEPTSFDPEYTYIFTSISNGVTSIMLRDSSGTRVITSYAEAELTFATTPPSRILEFNISGVLRNQDFEVSSKIVPLNFPSDGAITPNEGSGVAVKFRKVTQITSGAIAITSPLPNGFVGDSYNHFLEATGGQPPYTYTVHDGTVPTGLSLMQNGTIQGPLTAIGIFEFTLRVQDSSAVPKTGYRAYYVIVGDSTLKAADVLAGIGVHLPPEEEEEEEGEPEEPIVYPYPINAPVEGQAYLMMPDNLPTGFTVVIHDVSSTPTVLGIDGTIYPHTEEDPVIAYLWLKVINLVDPSDVAISAEPLEIPILPGYSNFPPVATEVNILGNASVGAVLMGSYIYSDLENDAEGPSMFKWYASSTGNVNDKSELPGANSISYPLTASEIGKYIFFEVTPVAVAGTSTGLPVLSPSTQPVSQNQPPEANDLKITGEPKRNVWLTGSYIYFDAEGDIQGATELKWYRSDDLTGPKVLIGTGSTYRTVGDDVGKYISFEVTPYALTGTSPGDSRMVSSIKITQN